MRARRLLEYGRNRNPLPEGALAVGAGLFVAGVSAYGFLVVSARALGPDRYASLAVLWALVFLFGPGLFLPLEQEVSRALSSRRARGIGGAPLLSRAGLLGSVLAGMVVVASLLAAGPMIERLFDDQVLLLVGLVIALAAYAAQHLVRGTLSGMGRFGRYGLVIGSEGLLRLAGCVGLAVAGVATAGPYGFVVALAPVAATVIALRKVREVVAPGPPASWRELSGALAYLLAGSFLAQLLVNASPVAVRLLASPSERHVAGPFLAGLVIARIPLFLFQAVTAALLPKLAGFVAKGQSADFRSGLRRVLTAVVLVGSLATLAAFTVGPWVVGLLFGSDFVLPRRDLGYLAGGSAAYMLAIALAQGLIALSAHARVAMGWCLGTGVFFIVTAFGTDLLVRVERGFLAGSLAAAAAMAGLLLPRLSGASSARAEDLLEAGKSLPFEP
ncbi:MAG: lipopolysaccharide biosynthesis protein [Candidatus Methylomirabilales bacterium]